MKANTLKLYFDHNIWVNLHKNQQIISVENQNQDINEIYKLLIQKKKEKKIQIITNFTQMLECKQRSDKKSRESIIKFVISTTNGYYQSPNPYIKKAELRNFCYDWLNRRYKKINIEDKYFGNSFEHLIGEYHLIPKNIQDVELLKKCEKIKEDARFLVNSLYVSFIMDYHEPNIIENQNNVDTHLKIRKSVQNIPEFKDRIKKLMGWGCYKISRRDYFR